MTKTITKRRSLTVFRALASTVILLLLLGTNLLYGQSLANYTFSTSTTGTLDPMTGATSLAGSGGIVAGYNDDNASGVANIGFTFYFMGTGYTQFSANSNGQMRLGGTAVASNFSSAAANTVGIAPIAGDNSTGRAGDLDPISYVVTGSAPNRILIVQWKNFAIPFSSTSANPANMQVWLYEGTGKIDYVYGAMTATATTRATFLSSSNTATTAGYVTISSTAGVAPTWTLSSTFTTNSLSGNINNLYSTSNGSRTVLSFLPSSNTPADPTTLTFTSVTASTITPNWVDNSSDENFFVVTRATDAAFTQNVTTAIVASTTKATTGTAYNLAQTALSPGTTYYYKVQAAVEGGAPGTGVTGSQATVAGITYYWIGSTGGAWATAANWNTDPAGAGSPRTTAATTDVMIVDGAGTTPGGSLTISVDATSFSIGQFKVTSNTTLSLASSATTTRAITITGGGGSDFVIESGSTLTTTNTTNAVSFAFSGTGNSGDISGTYNLGGSTSNVFSSTGGTGTLVTVGSTGIVNNAINGTTAVFLGSAATMSFASGATYNVTGATTGGSFIPLATWNANSNINYTSITTSTTAPTNIAQSFGNFTYNCSGASATMSAWTTGTTAVIKGNLTISATGSGKFRAVTTGTITINGNLNINGGYFEASSSTGTINVLGSINVSGGTMDVAQGGASNLKVKGDVTQTGGTITQTASTGFLEFNGTSASTLTLLVGSHGSNVVNVKSNNAAGVSVANATSVRNVTVTSGNFSGGGSFVYNGSSSVLTYNSSTGAQTASSFELPVSGGPSSLTINNTSTSPANVVNLPYSATLNGTAGVLTLTAGILDNSGYILTLSNTATGAVSGGSSTSYIKGAIARSIPASYSTASTYTFPVGKGSYNPFELVNPTTNSGGAATVQAEVFDANAGGTAGALMGTLKTNRYWAASLTSGAANFSGSLIKLNDAPSGADAIAGSATLTGAYDIVGGVSITSTSTSLTSTAPAASNIVGFYCMGNKAAATLSNLTITPSGNLCTNALRTVTVTATPGGGAVTGVSLNYSINGVAQTAVAMTNTSGNDWSGDIPTVTPANATVTWSVTATDVNLLTKSATGTSYTDEPLFTSSASISSSVSTICAGSSATLTANFVSAGGTATVGAGSTTSSATAASFFPGFWGGAKTQFIVRASELTAAGLRAGNITNIGYVPTTAGVTYQGFQMLVGHTTQTTTTTTYVPNASLTKVYEGPLTNSGILPVAGVVNNLTFGTGSGSASSFTWDGVSNLVISISWSLNPLASTSTATTMQVDNPGFTCSVYNQADQQTMAAMAAYTTGTTGSTRPKFIFTGIAAATPTSVSWSDGSSTFSTSNPVTVSASSTTTYTATIVASGCTLSPSPSITLNVATPPTAPTTNSTVSCPGLPTASVASTSGYSLPKFIWYSAASAGTTKQNSYATTYSTSLTATDTSYVTEIDTVTGCESSPRQQVISKVNTLTLAAVTPWFCGQGAQTDDITATSSDINFTSYTWSTSSPGASLNSSSGNPVTANLNATSLFSVAATDGNCTQNANITIGVYDFPTPNFTTTPNDTVCVGSQVTIGTGLVAGAFSSSSIAYSPLTAPVSAVNLVSAGAAVVPLTSGSLDDGGWGAIPMGFTFNFFGTPYTTINVGTNGTMMFGAYNANGGFTAPYGLGDYTFTTLPSTGEPFNMVACLANDNHLGLSGAIGPILRYWTEGTAPNRKFVVEYNNVRQYNNTNVSTAQAIFYETIGVVEVHVASSQSTNNKVIGINNSDGTIGALALATTATITTPVAYRFTPPANYTTVWSPSGSLAGTTSGTNIFQVTTNISTVGTTNVSLVLTNLTTGCTNALSPSSLDITTIALPADPITSGNTVCGQGSANLTVTNASSLNPTDTIKWYTAATGGSPIAWGDTYTTPTLTSSTTYYVETYNGYCVNNAGRVPVTLTVTVPDPLTVSSNYSTPLCPGGSTTINATQVGTTNTYSLTWTASDYTNSGMASATSTTLNNPITITPTAAGNYIFTITGIEAGTGCVVYGYDTVRSVSPFTGGKGASASPAVFCAGTSTTLTAAIGGSSATTSIGSATTTEFTYSPYRTGFGTGVVRQQLVFTAAELLASGVNAGNLTALTFNVSAAGSGYCDNYTISLGTASATTLTTTFDPAATTQVYTALTYTPIGGANVHTFQTPYFWNGSSDILVNICYTIGAGIGGSSTVSATTTPSAMNAGYLGAPSCATTTGATTAANRPWVQFTTTGLPISAISWSDGSSVVGTTNPLNVSPSTSTTYTATVTVFGCQDTVMVSVNPLPIPSDPTVSNSSHCGNQIPTCSASGTTNGNFRWYTDLIGGTAIAGEFNSTLSSYYIATTTTLYVSITNGTCESNRIPVTITVSTPDPVVASATQTSGVCANTSINLSVSQALSNNTYALTWSVNTPTGSGLSSSTAGAIGTPLTITPTQAGNYTYTISGIESSTGCVISSDVMVSVIDPFNGVNTSSGATATTVCAGSPTSLSAYAFTTNPAVYTAPPAVTYPINDEDLENITITQGTTTILNNTSANNSLVGTIGTATGTVGSYSDFTSFGPYAVSAGQTYDFSISSSTSGTFYNNAFGIYIDYNRNGVFTDAGEAVYISTSTVSGPHTETGSFTIPANASNGQTRMRVINNEGLVTAPDMTVFYGEYEEYVLDVASSNLSGGNVPTLSYSWSNGTSTVGTNNPLLVSPTTSTTYTPTLISSGCILVSTPITITVNPVAIAPSMPTTVSKTSSSIDVTWNSTSGATGYRLDVSTNSGFTTFVSGYQDLSVAGTSQSITGLATGTNYFIRVRAENGCGASSNSSTLSETTVSNVSIYLTAYLQGLYQGAGTMIAAPFAADGVTSSSIADTITVQLYTSSGSLAYSSNATLSTSGNALVSFPGGAIGNSYYIVIRHRNSIATSTASTVTIAATNANYNFSTAATQAMGDNLVDDGSGLFMIYTGDINQDGSVDFNDYPDLDISSSNGDLGYLPYDLNGDASVDFNDYPMIDVNSSNGIIAMLPF